MPLSPEQERRRDEARNLYGPLDRKTKALEDIADALNNIYLELVGRRPV